MKKIIFAIAFLFSLSYAKADDPGQACTTCLSSYTIGATGGAILFTSATINFIGITISSSAPNSYVAFYKSTSAVFTADISTLTSLATDYQSQNNNSSLVPIPWMANSSYTYINKVGGAILTYWFKCYPSVKGNLGLCGGNNSSAGSNSIFGPKN